MFGFSVQSNVAVQWLATNGHSIPSTPANELSLVQPSGVKKLEELFVESGEKGPPSKNEENSSTDDRLTELERLQKFEPELLDAPMQDGLLTMPQPYNDEDLFKIFIEKQEDEIDKLMNDHENLIDKEMDEFFDSFSSLEIFKYQIWRILLYN